MKPPSSSDGSSSEDGEPPPPSSSSSGMVYTSSACPTDAGSPRNRAQVRPPDGNEESMSDGSEGDAAGGTRPVKRARVSHSHSVLAPGTWTEAPQCPSASSSSASAGHDHGGHGKVVRNQTTALIDYPHGCSAGSLSNSHEFVAEVKVSALFYATSFLLHHTTLPIHTHLSLASLSSLFAHSLAECSKSCCIFCLQIFKCEYVSACFRDASSAVLATM